MSIKKEEDLERILENFEKNKDLAMKEIEDNLNLLCWIAWGIGEIFSEFTFEEMLAYMQNPNMDEIALQIRRERSELKTFEKRGFVLDNLFGIYKNGILQAYIGIDNQIKYSKSEIPYRLTAYLCALQFKISNFYSKKNYQFMKTVFDLWIFPITSYSNRIECHNLNDYYYVLEKGIAPEEKKWQVNETNKLIGYFFFLGDPDFDMIFEECFDLKEQKLVVILFIFDCLFAPDIEIEERLKALKPFNIYFNEEEVEALEMLNTDIAEVANSYFGEVLEEYQELRKQYKEFREKSKEEKENFKDKEREYKNKEREYKNKEREYKNKEREYKNKEREYKNKEREYKDKEKEYENRERKYKKELEEANKKLKELEEANKKLIEAGLKPVNTDF